MRTTSSLESLNATLKRWFPCRPHIYRFLECLKLHEYSKALDMLDAVETTTSAKQLQRRRKKDQKREEKIKFLTALFKNNENMSAAQFLELFATDIYDAEEVIQEEGKTFRGNSNKKYKSLIFLYRIN